MKYAGIKIVANPIIPKGMMVFGTGADRCPLCGCEEEIGPGRILPPLHPNERRCGDCHKWSVWPTEGAG